MDFKVLALCLMAVSFLYQMFLSTLSLRSAKNPMPENVKDIYDGETFQTWQSYSREKEKMEIVSNAASTLLTMLLIAFDVFSLAVGKAGSVYVRSILVVVLATVIDELVSIPFTYYNTMKIEQKYGFNKTTVKTFILDQVKEAVISLIMMTLLVCLLTLIHQTLGDWILVLFSAIMLAVTLIMGFLHPVFTKIFNHFTPLEDGSLKQKLTALLEKYGYQVKTIDVMDASRRTTRSNAYFTGFGKMKTIVLYDTLLEVMDEDEVCAVFAHEMGHGLHKDTLKNQLLSLVNIVVMAVLLWLTVRTPGVFESFGFAGVNYGFAMLLLVLAELPVFQPLSGLVMNGVSRRAEYRADQQAVQDGYGKPLSSALKKLSKENFADLSPAKLLVKLVYSHPPLSERLAAIEAEMKKAIQR